MVIKDSGGGASHNTSNNRIKRSQDVKSIYMKIAKRPEHSRSTAEYKQIKNILAVGLSKHQSLIEIVSFDQYEFKPLFHSPYPQLYHIHHKLFICKFCFAYFKCETSLRSHISKCTLLYPPGREIYRIQNLKFFYVDGASKSEYCRNLCLFSKLFIKNKTQYSNVDYFDFYILIVSDPSGQYFAGYFSKEKSPKWDYNLSCILVLPWHSGNGYGKMLIDLSYTLSFLDGKTGVPEGPLSDDGLMTYRKYWKEMLERQIATSKDDFNLEKICKNCGIDMDNAIDTLVYYELIKKCDDKIYIVDYKKTSKNISIPKKSQFLFFDPNDLKKNLVHNPE
ncbi:MAG: Histone acetyltransferase kat7 [Marteilia pararefringens]